MLCACRVRGLPARVPLKSPAPPEEKERRRSFVREESFLIRLSSPCCTLNFFAGSFGFRLLGAQPKRCQLFERPSLGNSRKFNLRPCETREAFLWPAEGKALLPYLGNFSRCCITEPGESQVFPLLPYCWYGDTEGLKLCNLFELPFNRFIDDHPYFSHFHLNARSGSI